MGLLSEDIIKSYRGAITIGGGSITSRTDEAVALLIQELHTEGILSKLRYLALFVGDSTIAFRIPVVRSRVPMVNNGSPTVTYSHFNGIAVTGSTTNALRTNFTPSQNGLNARNYYKGAYILTPNTTGVISGSGTTPGAVLGNDGAYLGLISPPQSNIGGVTCLYANGRTGLQSICADPVNTVSRHKYRLLESKANTATNTPLGETLVLNHWNNATNFSSDGSLGALIESAALNTAESGTLSALLDIFHYRIDRLQALDFCFVGDSITLGNILAIQNTRYSSQVCQALGITENNQGVSGSALQSGSWDGTVAPWVGRVNAQIINQAPSFLSIMIGTNDTYVGADYNVNTYTANLNTLLDTCFAAGMYHRAIFLHTIPHISNTWYSGYAWASQGKLRDYNFAIRDVARNRGVNLVDTWEVTARIGDSLLSDNLHPNVQGNRVIADNMHRVFTQTY